MTVFGTVVARRADERSVIRLPPGVYRADRCSAYPPYGPQAGSELAAAIGLVEALGVFLGGFRPDFAAPPQRAGKIRRALFVEGAAALLAIGRHLDQQVVDQVLHMP